MANLAALSDASADDWACVGVRVLSIALVPTGGGSAFTIWNAPTAAPYVNLEQPDQLAEILGTLSVRAGRVEVVGSLDSGTMVRVTGSRQTQGA